MDTSTEYDKLIWPTKVACQMFNAWPDREAIEDKNPFRSFLIRPFIKMIIFTSLIINALGLTFETIVFWGEDMNNTIESILMTIAFYMALLRVIMFQVHEKDMLRVIETMRQDWVNSTIEEEQLLRKKCHFAFEFTKIFFINIVIGFSFFITLPILEVKFGDGAEKKILPFHGYFFFDYSTSPLYEGMFIASSMVGVLVSNTIAGGTSFSFIASMHAAAKFAHIQEMVAKFNQSDWSLKERVRDLIQRHQRCIRFAEDVEEVINLLAFGQFIVSTGLVCFAGFQLRTVQIDGSSISSVSSNVSPSSVSRLILQSALDALGERRDYQANTADLVSAHKLIRSPYTIYKLTINIAPVCESVKKDCPRETCSLDVRQHEQGVIDVLQDSIQCKSESIQEQKVAENIEKQIINQSTSLDHEVQISTDHNDRPFIAVKATQSDYCPGCPYELNPSLPGLSAFGDQVLQAMDEAGISDFRHKLISIVRVTRSVPPSSNVVQYQLLMEIGESNCLRTSHIESSKCSTQSNLPIKLCLVTFEERPWQIGSRKITKNNCTDLLNTDNEVNGKIDPNSLFSEVTQATHREDENPTKAEFDDQIAQEAQEVVRIPSMDISTQHPTGEGDSAICEESSKTRASNEKEDGKSEPGKFSGKIKEFDEFLKDFDVPIKTETTTSKFASGTVTEEMMILEHEQKPSQEQSTESIDQAQQPFVASARSKRSAKEMRYKREMLLGGVRSLNPDGQEYKEEIQEYIRRGLQKYTEKYQGEKEPTIHRIKDMTVQVVAGQLFKIVTDIRTNTCKEGSASDCQLAGSERVKECTIQVFSQPWIDKGKPEITVECKEGNRRKRSLRGQNYSQKMLAQSRELKEIKLFHEFIVEYNKEYDSEEEKERRFQIFRQNLDMIEELQRNEQGTGRYGVTQFTDLTKAEFKAKYLGLKPSLRSENDIPLPKAAIPDIELPTEYDWRHYNAVTPVKNQGSCGSCWAFSVTGNVEGQYKIKHGKLLSFSEQELVDCDKLDEGCNGGLPDTAYRALEDLGGLELESDYPYDGVNEKCHFNKNKVRVSIVSGVNITSNETQMAQWLVQNGPMSIGINANAMQFYVGGVSHPFHFLCSPADLDHGVLIVGYGIKSYPIFKKKLPYWIIKNSWGPHWGEQGYYRVYRGDGSCGVNQMVSSAIIA
ncbi:hypothetical protein QAD02_001600 [Eretmocerus hayati]|uniref:Uncharacterized protein n=1 Tax=Eretmocerus hayati TaxID=131215 RepID=A0ACC2NGY4_9HYME|nr:hypothetical protein QAD02_001600 [Eretmocerus hayati]